MHTTRVQRFFLVLAAASLIGCNAYAYATEYAPWPTRFAYYYLSSAAPMYPIREPDVRTFPNRCTRDTQSFTHRGVVLCNTANTVGAPLKAAVAAFERSVESEWSAHVRARVVRYATATVAAGGILVAALAIYGVAVWIVSGSPGGLLGGKHIATGAASRSPDYLKPSS